MENAPDDPDRARTNQQAMFKTALLRRKQLLLKLLVELRSALIQRRDPPKAASTHKLGQILREVRLRRAFESEGYSTFQEFCERGLKEEVSDFGFEVAKQYIKVSRRFDANILAGVDLGISGLVAILGAPPRFRLRILPFAERMGLRSLRALVQDLKKETIPQEQKEAQILELEARYLPQIAKGPPKDRRQGERQPVTPNPRPQRPQVRPGRGLLPVPVPLLGNGDTPTELEEQGAKLLILLSEIKRQALELFNTPLQKRHPLYAPLELSVNRILHEYLDFTRSIADAFAPLAASAAVELRDGAPVPVDESALAKEAEAFDRYLPLPKLLLRVDVLESGKVPLLGYVTFSQDDPSDEPIQAPTEYQQGLFRLLGMAESLHGVLQQFCQLRIDGHLAEVAFYYQIVRALREPVGVLSALIDRGHPLLKETQKVRAAKESMRISRLTYMEDNLVVLGETFIPKQYAIIGRLRDGRYVAISLYSPQVIATIGSQGWGKSHMAVQISESCILAPEGVSKMEEQPILIWISSDWNHGLGNHQVLCGYNPNPYADQRQILAEQYMVKGQRYAYQGGVLLCLPGMKGRMEAIYGDLAERGLRIHEIRLNEREFGHFGLMQLLQIPEGSKNRAEQYLQALVTNEGPELSFGRLRERLAAAPVDRRSKAALLERFDYVLSLSSEEEYLIDHLEEVDGPICIFLESRHLGREGTLALETTILRALSGPLRSGKDPPRVNIIDEFSKRRVRGRTKEFYKEESSESRHQPNTKYLSGQLISDLPGQVLPLVTICGVFHLGSEVEFKKARRHLPGFSRVRASTIASLPRGVVWLSAARATDPSFTMHAQEVILRPTLVHAGGETLTAF